MSPDFCSLVGWLLKKDPLRRPTWPQLLAHPFWGNCQTPVPLEMPAQPRFDRALAVAASAASAGLKMKLPGQGNDQDFSACDSRERVGVEKHGPAGASRNFRVEGDQSMTLGVLNTNTQEESGGDRRGGRLDHRGREAALNGEGRSRQQEETIGAEVEGEATAPHGASADQVVHQTAALSGRGSPVQGTPRGDTGKGGTERVGEWAGGRIRSPPRSHQTRTESESRSSAAGTADVTKGQEGGGPDENRRGTEKGRRNHVPVHAMEDETTCTNAGRRQAEEGLKSTAPATVDGNERFRAPIHGYGYGYGGGDGGGGIREAAAGGVVNIGAARGGGRARAGAGDCDDAARRAAALDNLRLRGKIPPIPPGGRASSSVSASASSSVGEQYGSSFEEDTEGSSSYSIGAGSSEGPGIDAPAPAGAAAVPAAPRTPEAGSLSSSTRRCNRGGGASGIRFDKSGTSTGDGGGAAASGNTSTGTEGRAQPVTPPPRGSRRRTTGEAATTAPVDASRLEIASSPVTTAGGSGSRTGSGVGSGSGDTASGGLAAISFETGTSLSFEHGYSSPRTLSSHGSSARVGAENGQWGAGAGAGAGAGGDDSRGGKGGSGGSTHGQQQRRLAPSSQAGRAGGGAAQLEVGRDGGGRSGAKPAGALVNGRKVDRKCSPVKEEGTREGRRAALRLVGGVQRREGYEGNVNLAAVVEADAEGSDDTWGEIQGVQELLLHSSDAQVSPR